ncbi:MAG: tyrosine recombinase XerC [Burkholderiaceae bacterium]
MNALPPPMAEWLEMLGSQRRYSVHTLAGYRRDLQLLCKQLGALPLDQVAEGHIRQAVARLHAAGHQARSLARMLSAWRGFYDWWAPRIGLSANPAHGVRAPKAARGLPKALSVDQTQSLLDRNGLPAPLTAVEWRDQAMFEVLYSSGLRLAELVSLDHRHTRSHYHESQSWVDLDSGDAIVRGKGGKTRSVPLGRKAIEALRHWLQHRPGLERNPPRNESDAAALFLGTRGARISPRVVQKQLAELALKAGLPVHVHPHSLRHSFASHLLQSAQDLRAVQELLGHANISTTQIYTRLDFQHLAQVYDKAHPRAGRKSDTE